ncbi:MAG TPA: hypothetical protein PK971_10485 [Saprospiraceae bacterium]|nr:hypothetical protein [Saprospiraceae bacterium]HND88745.1 hypothetical protein [Saprospiraceae bacterium]
MRQLFLAVCAVLLLAACQSGPSHHPNSVRLPDAGAILRHKYWVAKPFRDALFAPRIPDTISYMLCTELLFRQMDTVLLTSCMSDAALGLFEVTDHNTLSITFDGDTTHRYIARLDEATGVLHLSYPPDRAANNPHPTEYVAEESVGTANMDELTVSLARKRLSGTYQPLAEKGSPVVLNPDGSQSGLGAFDRYEPYVAGIGSGTIQEPPMNVIYLYNRGREHEQTALGWQLSGDTLRLWDTRNIAGKEEMPHYKATHLHGTYLRSR